MAAYDEPIVVSPGQSIPLASPEFARRKYEWYAHLLEEAPVARARISLMRMFVVSRYEDCRTILTDERFVRDRGHALGKPASGPLPIPLPRGVAALSKSMIVQDDPEHQRLRSLVNKAFTTRAVEQLEDGVEDIVEELLLEVEREAKAGPVDLMAVYARPIPTRVIGKMLGVASEDMATFQQKMTVLTDGLSGWRIARSLFWDLRKTAQFVRELIDRKRASPSDDLLSRLIEVEEEGARLGEDELLAMVFLLVVAGFETTLHLIVNGARTVIEEVPSKERLRQDPSLWESAVEEIVRFRGPVHGTKLQYASCDLKLHGTLVRRGQAVMPLLGAANMDPRAFSAPEKFEIDRKPNHHLGFGFGRHYCLGRSLALMESRVALQRLFERFPEICLALPAEELEIARLPGWHRHVRLPVSVSA